MANPVNVQSTRPLVSASSLTIGTYYTSNFYNPDHRGMNVYINISAVGGGTLTVTLQGVDDLSGGTYTVLASSALNGTGLTVLQIYPGLTASANSIVSAPLPSTWNIKYVGAVGTPSFTISAALLV